MKVSRRSAQFYVERTSSQIKNLARTSFTVSNWVSCTVWQQVTDRNAAQNVYNRDVSECIAKIIWYKTLAQCGYQFCRRRMNYVCGWFSIVSRVAMWTIKPADRETLWNVHLESTATVLRITQPKQKHNGTKKNIEKQSNQQVIGLCAPVAQLPRSMIPLRTDINHTKCKKMNPSDFSARHTFPRQPVIRTHNIPKQFEPAE